MDTRFRRDGFLHVRGVLDVETVKNVRAHFWDEIGKQFGIRVDDPDTWFTNPKQSAGDVRGRRLPGMNPIMQSLKDSGALNAVESSLQRAVDESLGPARWFPKPNWYSLLSFPRGDDNWNVPHSSWHADEPIAAGHAHPWTVFAFVFLEAVEPRGGATVVVSGSHRRGERLAQRVGTVNESLVRAFADDNDGLIANPQELRVLSSPELLGLLASRDPWVRDLVSEGSPRERIRRFMNKRTVSDGIPLEVVETTGAVGDVVFLDPRCLHSGSANTRGAPRQVLRLDFRRQSSEEEKDEARR